MFDDNFADTTVIVHSADVSCSWHEDGSVVDLSSSWTAGAPLALQGNAHPLESGAAAWQRCSGCSRLFLRRATRSSSRMPVAQTERKYVVATTHLNEADPDVTHNTVTPLLSKLNSLTDSSVIVLKIPAVVPGADVPARARIIRAVLSADIVAVTGFPVVSVYPLLRPRSEMNIAEMTWNEYASGEAWDVPGAGHEGDRDEGKRLVASLAVAGTGRRYFLTNLLSEVQSRTEEWYIAIYGAASGADSFTMKGAPEAAEDDRPYLRVVYEQPRRGVGS